MDDTDVLSQVAMLSLADLEVARMVEAASRALATCPPLEPVLTPTRAFVLTAFLIQFQPYIDPRSDSAEVIAQMAQTLIARFSQHDQAIADLLIRMVEDAAYNNNPPDEL